MAIPKYCRKSWMLPNNRKSCVTLPNIAGNMYLDSQAILANDEAVEKWLDVNHVPAVEVLVYWLLSIWILCDESNYVWNAII